MIQVENDWQVHGYEDGCISAVSDLPGLQQFRLLVPHEEWRQFVKRVKQGFYDLDESNQLPASRHQEVYR